jgi:hypothetical protein
MKEDNVIKFPGKLKRTNISLERVCDLANRYYGY